MSGVLSQAENNIIGVFGEGGSIAFRGWGTEKKLHPACMCLPKVIPDLSWLSLALSLPVWIEYLVTQTRSVFATEKSLIKSRCMQNEAWRSNARSQLAWALGFSIQCLHAWLLSLSGSGVWQGCWLLSLSALRNMLTLNQCNYLWQILHMEVDDLSFWLGKVSQPFAKERCTNKLMSRARSQTKTKAIGSNCKNRH